MGKIILICGKVCVGKSTYARKLMKEMPAVRLNADEIMKTLFGEHLGDQHELVFQKTMQYLNQKAVELYTCGICVILDCGYWYRRSREEANLFFHSHGIKPEWHYVHVSEATWQKNIQKRNASALLPGSSDYFLDENILAKFADPMDEPRREEMDFWIENIY